MYVKRFIDDGAGFHIWTEEQFKTWLVEVVMTEVSRSPPARELADVQPKLKKDDHHFPHWKSLRRGVCHADDFFQTFPVRTVGS